MNNLSFVHLSEHYLLPNQFPKQLEYPRPSPPIDSYYNSSSDLFIVPIVLRSRYAGRAYTGQCPLIHYCGFAPIPTPLPISNCLSDWPTTTLVSLIMNSWVTRVDSFFINLNPFTWLPTEMPKRPKSLQVVHNILYSPDYYRPPNKHWVLLGRRQMNLAFPNIYLLGVYI